MTSVVGYENSLWHESKNTKAYHACMNSRTNEFNISSIKREKCAFKIVIISADIIKIYREIYKIDKI